MKILGIGAGGDDPATRFRIVEHLNLLNKKNVQADYLEFRIQKFGIPESKINKVLKFTKFNPYYFWDFWRLIERGNVILKYPSYDFILLNRVLIPCRYTYERLIAKKLAFDFDDAIWLNEAKGFLPSVFKKSRLVFAGNEYLADYANNYSKDVFVIPTGIDCLKYCPSDKVGNEFVFGWIGSASNLEYLEKISNVIIRFLNKFPSSQFWIMSNAVPDGFASCQQVKFIQWSREKEVDFLQKIDVGIMPIENDDWSKGKCSFKMIQYMACGKPVIVSPYGMNREILNKGMVGLGPLSEDDWYDALLQFYNDESFRKSAGNKAREVALNNYSLHSINEKILKVLNQYRD